MRVLLIHNRYRAPGGEDVIFESEAALLRRKGIDVRTHVDSNDRTTGWGPVALAAGTIWSSESKRRAQAVIREMRPAVVHVHNTFFALSPSVYHAARVERVPLVQTLHNYRLICPGVNLLRDGRPCEDCVGRRVAWPGVLHACYRDSRAATGAVAAMLAVHRWLGTWTRCVDRHIVLTEFARRKLLAAGLPPDRVVVKPNFLEGDPGPGTHRGGYALFVGRLSAEKGVDTLVTAWRRAGTTVPLKIVGAGPLRGLGETEVPGVEWLGWRARREVLELMKDAAFLVLPSSCYEGFPVTIAEAFATGLPVIASGHGALREIVEDGRTGLHVVPGSAVDLADKAMRAASRPAWLAAMGRAARAEFEEKYTPERNFAALMDIYRAAIGMRDVAGGVGAATRVAGDASRPVHPPEKAA